MDSGEQLCDPHLYFRLEVIYSARSPLKVHEPISQSRLTFGEIQILASIAIAKAHAGTPGTSVGMMGTYCSRCDDLSNAVKWGPACRVGVNLFQIDSKAVGGQYAAPLLLGISKRSLLEGAASTPAYAAYSGWHADSMFSLVPAKMQVMSLGLSFPVDEAPIAGLLAPQHDMPSPILILA